MDFRRLHRIHSRKLGGGEFRQRTAIAKEEREPLYEQKGPTGEQQKAKLEPALWENLVFVYQFKDLEHKRGSH